MTVRRPPPATATTTSASPNRAPRQEKPACMRPATAWQQQGSKPRRSERTLQQAHERTGTKPPRPTWHRVKRRDDVGGTAATPQATASDVAQREQGRERATSSTRARAASHVQAEGKDPGTAGGARGRTSSAPCARLPGALRGKAAAASTSTGRGAARPKRHEGRRTSDSGPPQSPSGGAGGHPTPSA